VHSIVQGILVLGAVLATGCDRESDAPSDGALSASAAAESDSSGRVVMRGLTPEELALHADIRERSEAVDRRFPRGAFPQHVPRTRGVRMLPTGEIVLNDGRTIRFDGVSCSEQGYEYLSRLFLDPSSSLVVVTTGSPVEGVTPAEVWIVEDREGGGISYSFPVDAGISSGWCDPKPSSTSPHNDRFAALATAFDAERKAYARSAP